MVNSIESSDYYSQKLSAERLRKCYEIAPPRAQRYLEAEIEFVLNKIPPSAMVLELGCGYGRVLGRLATRAREVVGIDTSYGSLLLARDMNRDAPWYHLCQMNALKLGFRDRAFDMVVCIQNGISAFKVNQRELIREAIRATRPGGIALFSSYSDRFWEHRLEWFRIQSEQGLIGEIDYDATGDGVIVCKDGFRASTVGPEEFISLTSGLNVVPIISEVDESSIFCEIPAQ